MYASVSLRQACTAAMRPHAAASTSWSCAGSRARDGSGRLLEHVLQRALGILHQLHAGEPDPPEPFGMAVPGFARERHAFLERRPSSLELVGFLQSLAEAHAEERAHVSVGDELDGAGEQVHRRVNVLPGHGCLRGGPEPLRSSSSDDRVDGPELGPVAVRLLEVVADDLVRSVVSESRLEPVRVPLVQVARCRLGIAS